jgi:uncharacterized protein (DUF2267 family)
MRYLEMVRYVERVIADGRDTEGVERAIVVTLEALSRCLPHDEAAALASQLPVELQSPLAEAPTQPQRMSVEEFLRHVADRENVSPSEALHHCRAVFDGLAEAVTGHELRRVREHLPAEFDTLFAPPAASRWPQTHRRRPHP